MARRGLQAPIWLLGSSLFSAELAGHLGLPYAFASHFAPELLMQGLQTYRAGFRPSSVLEKPYAMAAINVFAAETDAAAEWLSTSMQQAFAAVVTGKPGRVKPPVDDIAAVLDARQLAAVQSRLTYAAIGGRETVRAKLAEFIGQTGVDEVMVTGMVFAIDDRIRSLEITAEALAGL
ncbi:MsnO8 family LLM class oxidoreductase [Brevundimonas sp.]|uniref:MsnO8 family LLM class oxidoreductase n=1 Tax=Brevundimonas sp. TaxID=1871086 RepID=UPI0035202F24